MDETNIFYAIVTYENISWSDMPDIYTYYKNKTKALKDMLRFRRIASEEARENYLLSGHPGKGIKYESDLGCYLEELNFND